MKTPLAASLLALLASVPSVAAAPQFQSSAPVAYLQVLGTMVDFKIYEDKKNLR